jgi:hypothetical protein
MHATSKLTWVGAALLAMATSIAGCGSSGSSAATTGGMACVPGTQQACACVGTMSVQVCKDDGEGFDKCQCGSSSGTGGASSSSSTGMPGTCGDGIPQAGECGPEGTCKQDCMGTSSSSGTGGSCAGQLHYAGKIDGASSVWSGLSGTMGAMGLEAGNNACVSQVGGSDHVCDYEEVLKAAAANEALFANIPQGTTAWVQRTTDAMVMGTNSPAGPGGRCNNWTYMTNHISDGEYATFDTKGVPTFHLDNDTTYDAANPKVNATDLQCGGTTRSILCCYQACN